MQQHKLLRQMSHSKFIGLYYVKVKGILPIMMFMDYFIVLQFT